MNMPSIYFCLSVQVFYILSRCSYFRDECVDKDKKGIKRLLNNGTYSAAFPLHDVSVSPTTVPANFSARKIPSQYCDVHLCPSCPRAVQVLDAIAGPKL